MLILKLNPAPDVGHTSTTYLVENTSPASTLAKTTTVTNDITELYIPIESVEGESYKVTITRHFDDAADVVHEPIIIHPNKEGTASVRPYLTDASAFSMDKDSLNFFLNREIKDVGIFKDSIRVIAKSGANIVHDVTIPYTNSFSLPEIIPLLDIDLPHTITVIVNNLDGTIEAPQSFHAETLNLTGVLVTFAISGTSIANIPVGMDVEIHTSGSPELLSISLLNSNNIELDKKLPSLTNGYIFPSYLVKPGHRYSILARSRIISNGAYVISEDRFAFSILNQIGSTPISLITKVFNNITPYTDANSVLKNSSTKQATFSSSASLVRYAGDIVKVNTVDEISVLDTLVNNFPFTKTLAYGIESVVAMSDTINIITSHNGIASLAPNVTGPTPITLLGDIALLNDTIVYLDIRDTKLFLVLISTDTRYANKEVEYKFPTSRVSLTTLDGSLIWIHASSFVDNAHRIYNPYTGLTIDIKSPIVYTNEVYPSLSIDGATRYFNGTDGLIEKYNEETGDIDLYTIATLDTLTGVYTTQYNKILLRTAADLVEFN